MSCSVVSLASAPPAAAVVFPGATWETAGPAEMGLHTDALDDFRDAVGGQGPGVVVKDGILVYSWGDPSSLGSWGSAEKAVFSTLLFFAVKEGRVPGVDVKLSSLGWSLSSKDRNVTLRQLANMLSGYSLPEAPGTRWAYNDYAVSLYKRSIIERIFGVDPSNEVAMGELANAPSRLGALQLEDGLVFATGASPPTLLISARDLARIGWFWLNGGNWGGALLPLATYAKPGVAADVPRTGGGGPDDYLGVGTDGGPNDQTPLGPGSFGFMWWFNPERVTWPSAPADTFQVNGHWNGEVMTMIPSLGLVAAWRGGQVEDPESAFNASMDGILSLLLRAVATSCNDGVDNDGDGGTDWDGAGSGVADSWCTDPWSPNEDRPSCGLGPGAAPLLLLAGRLRARRRAPA